MAYEDTNRDREPGRDRFTGGREREREGYEREARFGARGGWSDEGRGREPERKSSGPSWTSGEDRSRGQNWDGRPTRESQGFATDWQGRGQTSSSYEPGMYGGSSQGGPGYGGSSQGGGYGGGDYGPGTWSSGPSSSGAGPYVGYGDERSGARYGREDERGSWHAYGASGFEGSSGPWHPSRETSRSWPQAGEPGWSQPSWRGPISGRGRREDERGRWSMGDGGSAWGESGPRGGRQSGYGTAEFGYGDYGPIGDTVRGPSSSDWGGSGGRGSSMTEGWAGSVGSGYGAYGLGGRSLGGQRLRGPHTGRGPMGYRRSEERIQEDVSERLAADGDVDASEIEVRVEGNEVILSGTVGTRREKRLAEDILEGIPGVDDVTNHLRVRSPQSAGQSAGQSGRGDSPSGRASQSSRGSSDGRHSNDPSTSRSSGSRSGSESVLTSAGSQSKNPSSSGSTTSGSSGSSQKSQSRTSGSDS